MSCEASLKRLLDGGPLGGTIVLEDPEFGGRVRNVYEDIGYDKDVRARMATLRLYPEHALAQAVGDEDSGVVTLTHSQVRDDVAKMLRLGYIAV